MDDNILVIGIAGGHGQRQNHPDEQSDLPL